MINDNQKLYDLFNCHIGDRKNPAFSSIHYLDENNNDALVLASNSDATYHILTSVAKALDPYDTYIKHPQKNLECTPSDELQAQVLGYDNGFLIFGSNGFAAYFTNTPESLFKLIPGAVKQFVEMKYNKEDKTIRGVCSTQTVINGRRTMVGLYEKESDLQNLIDINNNHIADQILGDIISEMKKPSENTSEPSMSE